MSIYDYETSKQVDPDISFYGIIMAAMRRADSDNAEMLKRCWPQVWKELEARYWAPGGLLEGEDDGLS